MSPADAGEAGRRDSGAGVGFWRGPGLLIVAAVGMYVLLAGAPLVRGIPPLPASVAITVLFIFATLAVAAAAARVAMPWWLELPGAAVCLALWYVLAGVGEEKTAVRLATVPAADVAFLVACVLAGRLLSRIISERNLLLPVALVLGLADIFTVFIGPTGALLKRAPELVANLSIRVPQVGSAAGAQGAAGLAHVATMGPGDLVFASLLLVGAVRFGLSLRRNFIGILVPVVVGLGGFILVPFLPGVPVLPLMVIGFLIANRGCFKLTAAEKRNMGIAAVFIVALFAGLWLLMRALLAASPAPPAGAGAATHTAAIFLGGIASGRHL